MSDKSPTPSTHLRRTRGNKFNMPDFQPEREPDNEKKKVTEPRVGKRQFEAFQKITYGLAAGIILVLFVCLIGITVAIGGIMVDGFRSKEASYTELVKTIEERTGQNESQTHELEILTKKIGDLQWMISQQGK